MISPDDFKVFEEDSSRVRNICVFSCSEDVGEVFFDENIQSSISQFVHISLKDPNQRLFETKPDGMASPGDDLHFPIYGFKQKKFSFLFRDKNGKQNEENEEERDFDLFNFYDIPSKEYIDENDSLDERFRLFDGAICIVGWEKSVGLNTLMNLKTCGAMKVKCLIFIDFGRDLGERQYSMLNSKEILENTKRRIQRCNQFYHEGLISMKCENDESVHSTNEHFSPRKLNVIFGSVHHGWAFTFDHIHSVCRPKSVEKSQFFKYLWEDHYYFDKNKKKIMHQEDSDQRLMIRNGVFHELLMKPIFKFYEIGIHRRIRTMRKIFSGLGRSKSEVDEVERLLRKYTHDGRRGGSSAPRFSRLFRIRRIRSVMCAIFPLHECIKELVFLNLPTSRIANRYRSYGNNIIIPRLKYDLDLLESVYHSNPDGRLYMLIHDVVIGVRKECIGFGRVFSGCLSKYQKVSILCSDGKTEHGKIKGIVVLSGRTYGYLGHNNNEEEEEEDTINFSCVGGCGIVLYDENDGKSQKLMNMHEEGGLIVVTDYFDEDDNNIISKGSVSEEMIRLLDCMNDEYGITLYRR